MSSPSDDDEPDWLIQQASDRKERAVLSRLSDSSDFSVANDSDGDVADGGTAKISHANAEEKGESKAKGKGRAPPSSILPLLLAPKVRRDVMLLEAEDPNLDLSGDFGCIGKLHVRKAGSGSGASGSAQAEGVGEGGVTELRQTLMLDLKGKVYDADIVPCNSLCMVTVDANKAKIDTVFSDFVQLAPPRDSIFDMQEVHGGDFGAGFFDDEEVLSQVDGEEEEEELGPLKEKRGGAKLAAKQKKKTVR